MWTIYKRINRIDGKTYVGVTSQSIEDRWKIDVGSAAKIAKKIERANKHRPATRRQAAIDKTNDKRFTGTLAYAVWKYGADSDAWEHIVVHTCDNVVEALLREQEEIAKLDGRLVYNRSRGGEIPKYMTIDKLLTAVDEHRLRK